MLSELNQQHPNCRISSGTAYLFDGDFNLRRIASLTIQYISLQVNGDNDPYFEGDVKQVKRILL